MRTVGTEWKAKDRGSEHLRIVLSIFYYAV